MNSSSQNPAEGAGTPESKSLKVHKLEDLWIVENEEGSSLGEAGNREEAIEVARKAGAKEGASTIAVHKEDGQLETTLDL